MDEIMAEIAHGNSETPRPLPKKKTKCLRALAKTHR